MKRNVRIALLMLSGLIALAGASTGLLFVVPAALLVAGLALGYYPGERVLLAHRRGDLVRRRPLAARAMDSTGRPPHALAPLGSALLAFHRAVRPPPAPAVV